MDGAPKPALVVRCPSKGHALARVVYEAGRAYADCSVPVHALVRDGDGNGVGIQPQRRSWSRFDLAAEAEAGLQVEVACGCGLTSLDLGWLHAQIAAGRRGKLLVQRRIQPYTVT